ncbi:MAG: hypothetical protein KIT56_11215, partial [Gammaproteobacteria bacterium]|nr:hypothetical protein [Gammaproteobacteria bacterium]
MNLIQFRRLYEELNFCYEQTILADRLTDEVTGELDIEAYQNEEVSCWRTYDVTTVPVKKNIILTSWYMEHLNERQREELVLLLRRLIEIGHAVYVPSEDGLRRIENMVLLEKELLSLKPIKTETAIALAAKQGLRQEALDIINTRRLQEITKHLQEVVGIYGDGGKITFPSLDAIEIKRKMPRLKNVIDKEDKFFQIFRRDTKLTEPSLK